MLIQSAIASANEIMNSTTHSNYGCALDFSGVESFDSNESDFDWSLNGKQNTKTKKQKQNNHNHNNKHKSKKSRNNNDSNNNNNNNNKA